MQPTTVPKSKSKSEIQEMLKGWGSVLIRSEIIKVVMKNRKVPEKQAKDIKIIYATEVAQILEEFDKM